MGNITALIQATSLMQEHVSALLFFHLLVRPALIKGLWANGRTGGQKGMCVPFTDVKFPATTVCCNIKSAVDAPPPSPEG